MDYRVLDEALAYLNGDSYEDGYVYESLQDEFNLDLMLLEAEQELFSEIQLESADIEVLNEGIREGLTRTLCICLDNEVEFVELTKCNTMCNLLK